MIANEDPRVCGRCGVRRHGDHVCADIEARREKQERIINLIHDVLLEHGAYDEFTPREVAEEVYKAIRDRIPFE